MLVCAALLAFVASPAHAQATRTYLSATGDDANPCTRSAPCRSFAGTVAKTAAGGEVTCLDAGGPGTVTITKSITIDCEGVTGGTLATVANGITISNAPPGTKVNLRGLDINGAGTGTNGVRILIAADVSIQNSKIFGFAARGISVEGGGSLVIENTTIQNNAAGVVVDGTGGAAKVTIKNARILKNTNNGITVQNAGAQAMVERTTITDNGGTGMTVTGSGALGFIGNSTVTGNATGVSAASSGTLYSFQQNQIAGNTNDGTPLAAFPGPGGTALQ